MANRHILKDANDKNLFAYLFTGSPILSTDKTHNE